MSRLIVLLLAMQASIIFGRVTVLKEADKTNGRKLLCVSEDDGGGLVWNSHLHWQYSNYEFSDRVTQSDFVYFNRYEKGQIDCDFSLHSECASSWNDGGKRTWNRTNSIITPMGPVFDHRWEGFTEYTNFYKKDSHLLIDDLKGFARLKRSGALVISVRAVNDFYVTLCEGENYRADSCYWIVIGGWENTESVIRKCVNGVPEVGVFPMDKSCENFRASYKHEGLSPAEWRTYVLTWNEATRNISLYDTKNLLLSYVDTEQQQATRYSYVLFLSSRVEMLARIHAYEFLYTTDPKAVRTSPEFTLYSTNLCLEMTIGLCAECGMEVVLVSSHDENLGESLKTIKGSTSAHGLAMWQYVRMNQPVKMNGSISFQVGQSVKLKFIPSLVQQSANPLWAMGNIRECPPADTLRYGTMTAQRDYLYSNYFWPNVTCQKLLYNDNTVVDSITDAKADMQFEEPNCTEAHVGPYCAINCNRHFSDNVNCKGIVICEKNGCACPPGYTGPNCISDCHIGNYGQDCKHTCGVCLHANCNFRTGVCNSGCDNSQRYYVPPYCRIGIDNLPPPTIDYIRATTVQVIVPVLSEYTLTPSGYQFAIQKKGESRVRYVGAISQLFKNTTSLTGYIDDLEPGTSYKISCALYVNSMTYEIAGEWQNFTTNCTRLADFEIEVTNTSLTLGMNQKTILHPCPMNWYDFLLENNETGAVLGNGTLTKLQFVNLSPYTPYKITIGKERKVLFSRKVRTLDGVPSSVRNITVSITDKEVMLQWNKPEYSNGIIVKYEVTLELDRYIGCSNRNVPAHKRNVYKTTTELTNTTFLNLAPYAEYSARIAAYTSYRGPERSVSFSTKQKEVPTAVYSNFRFQNYILNWDAPEDCTTISGPIFAKIIVKGVSRAVANIHFSKQTSRYSIDLTLALHGAETYEARIHAIRNFRKPENDAIYQRVIFTTPPKAPPPVRELEIFEVDILNRRIYLRWQPPQPPVNGEIEFYALTVCYHYNSCKIPLKIPPSQYCKLWTNYVCATIQEVNRWGKSVVVAAANVNVSAYGTARTLGIPKTPVIPGAPKKFEIENLERGIVNTSWSHPWLPGGHIEKFSLTVRMTSSNLRKRMEETRRGIVYDYHVNEYESEYNQLLHLLPSSAYEISIRAVTNTNLYGREEIRNVKTPLAIGFEEELSLEVNTYSSILLHIPAVINDTRNSVMSVVLKGPRLCEGATKLLANLREKIGIRNNENAWYAAIFPTNMFAGKTFTVGDNELYGNVLNCPLRQQESYMIMVIVQTNEESMGEQIIVMNTTSIRIGEASRRHDEAWVILVAIFLALACLAFYVYRRKKRRTLEKIVVQEAMELSTNEERPPEKPIGSSNCKQFALSTTPPSDKESLSHANTAYDDKAVLVNDVNQKEEGSTLVKVKDIEDYVKNGIKSGLFDEQYNTLPRGKTKPWEYGMLPENKQKNRYINLITYDENRVILQKLPDDPYSDYINASYVKGYKKEKWYIATQGPKPNTVIDFWRMIWQEESLIICMLANTIEGGKTKCEQYWPDIRKKKKYGDIVVFNAEHTVFADYTFRTLIVKCDGKTRKIEQLHYTAWPDHGVPLSTHSVVTYLKKLLATSPGNGPVVAHCSAGVGRTGTIILCDICLRRAAAEGVVDVFGETRSIRSQRANMVDTKQQYLLAHLTLVECLLSFSTSLPCNESLPIGLNELKKKLSIQHQSLQKTAWQDEALRPSPINQTPLSERNRGKNRFPELISEKVSRVYLKRYPPSDEDSDYISAVYVDGVRLQNQYLATQLPMPATFGDFWRMIAEYKVELIVALQPPDPNDPTCCPLVPSGEFKPVPYMNIRTKDFDEFECYTLQKLTLIDNSEKPAREQQVAILCSTEWKPGRDQEPPTTMALVALWQATERISRGDGPTVVLCHDGVTGCGLYLALGFLLERMTVERECDVCLAIRAIRRSRTEFVQSLEQMGYLYDAATTYLKYFETYANFT